MFGTFIGSGLKASMLVEQTKKSSQPGPNTLSLG